MQSRPWLALAVAGALLAACGEHSERISLANGKLRLEGTEVTIVKSKGPDAHLTAAGELRIGGEVVVLTPEQRAQVQKYYAATVAIRGHAIETGKAGAEVGATAAKEVVSGLLHGDASQIGSKIEAKAEIVKAAARGICSDVADIRDAQQSLVTTLESFRPYAVVEEADIADCRRDVSGTPAS